MVMYNPVYIPFKSTPKCFKFVCSEFPLRLGSHIASKHIDFPKPVALGTSRSIYLDIENPTHDVITVDIVHKSEFKIWPTQLIISPKQTSSVQISWLPTEVKHLSQVLNIRHGQLAVDIHVEAESYNPSLFQSSRSQGSPNLLAHVSLLPVKYPSRVSRKRKREELNVKLRRVVYVEEITSRFLKDEENILVLFGDTDLDNNRKRGVLRLYTDGMRKTVYGFDRTKAFGIITSWKESLEPKIGDYRKYLGKIHDQLIAKATKGIEIIVPEPTSDDLENHKDMFCRDGKQVIFHTIGFDDKLDFDFRLDIQKMLEFVDEEIIGLQNAASSNARKRMRLEDDIKNNRRRTKITLQELPSHKYNHSSKEGKRNQKQMKALTKWFNWMLRDELFGDHKLQTIIDYRRRKKHHRKAKEFWHKEDIKHDRLTIVNEVSSGSLKFVDNRNVLCDDEFQNHILEIFGCFNESWLRLGLQMVFQRKITPERGLEKCLGFIRSNLFHSDIVDKDFIEGGESNLMLPRDQQQFRSGYKSAMESHILRHILDLLLFFEQGKKAKFFEGNPSLFEEEKRYQSFSDIYKDFFTKWVKDGEALLASFASKMNASMDYTQFVAKPASKIVDIYEDFRDGFVLIRFAEKVTQKKLFHKVHSVIDDPSHIRDHLEIALKELVSDGLNLTGIIQNRMLLDGNSEFDLIIDCLAIADERVVQRVAWRIVQHYVFEKVLNECDFPAIMEAFESVTSEKELPDLQFMDIDPKIKEKLPVIFQWVQAIGRKHELTVNDLSDSLWDGMIFCMIFHHYLPSIIPRDRIETVANDLERGKVNQNIKLVKQALVYIGHCPDLLGSVGPTDPLIAGIQLAYIARRLLAIDAERRLQIGMSASLKQSSMYQGFMERKQTIIQELSQKQEESQKAIRESAGQTVGSILRSTCARNSIIQRIQTVQDLASFLASRNARHKFLEYASAANEVQQLILLSHRQQVHKEKAEAVERIQSLIQVKIKTLPTNFVDIAQAGILRKNLLMKKKGISFIQSALRSKLEQLRFLNKEFRPLCVVQNAILCSIAQKEVKKKEDAVRQIQNYLKLKNTIFKKCLREHNVGEVQAIIRSQLEQENLSRKINSIHDLQNLLKCAYQQKIFQIRKDESAQVTVVQALLRSKLEQHRLEQKKGNIISIQLLMKSRAEWERLRNQALQEEAAIQVSLLLLNRIAHERFRKKQDAVALAQNMMKASRTRQFYIQEQKKRQEEEKRRLEAENERIRKLEEEKEKRRIEEERKRAEEQRLRMEEEQRKREEEIRRREKEAEELRIRQLEAQKRAEEEAERKRKAEEDERKRKEREELQKQLEAQKRAEEEAERKRKAEEKERKRKEREEQLRKQEERERREKEERKRKEEAERKRKAAEEERKRKEREEQLRKQVEERKRKEKEERERIIEEQRKREEKKERERQQREEEERRAKEAARLQEEKMNQIQTVQSFIRTKLAIVRHRKAEASIGLVQASFRSQTLQPRYEKNRILLKTLHRALRGKLLRVENPKYHKSYLEKSREWRPEETLSVKAERAMAAFSKVRKKTFFRAIYGIEESIKTLGYIFFCNECLCQKYVKDPETKFIQQMVLVMECSREIAHGRRCLKLSFDLLHAVVSHDSCLDFILSNDFILDEFSQFVNSRKIIKCDHECYMIMARMILQGLDKIRNFDAKISEIQDLISGCERTSDLFDAKKEKMVRQRRNPELIREITVACEALNKLKDRLSRRRRSRRARTSSLLTI